MKKVLLVLALLSSFHSVSANETKKPGEVSSQAVDCEAILAAQGAKPLPVETKEDSPKDSSKTKSQ